jgi:hypothetical protein
MEIFLWKFLRRVSYLLFLIACSAICVSSEENDAIDDSESIWETKPVEIDNVNVQILDKISGKVYKSKIKLNVPQAFGSIKIKLKRAFKNSPEDDKEIYAFIEIKEKNKVIFANWLFASAPSVNIFENPIYDIRVEF